MRFSCRRKQPCLAHSTRITRCRHSFVADIHRIYRLSPGSSSFNHIIHLSMIHLVIYEKERDEQLPMRLSHLPHHNNLHTTIKDITSIEDTASVVLLLILSHQPHPFHFNRKALISRILNARDNQHTVNACIDVHLYPQCYLKFKNPLSRHAR